MSRIFLTNLDLNANQLLNVGLHAASVAPSSPTPVEGQIYYNTSDDKIYSYDGATWNSIGASTEEIQDAINAALVAGAGISKVYDDNAGTITVSNTGVLALTGTSNEVEVSAASGSVQIGLPSTISVDVNGNASTASTLQNARTISLGGDLSGSVSFNGGSNVTLNATIEANSVALGTDTTGDYVASVTGSGNGISVSGTGEGAAVTISNTGVTSITSQDATEIYVSGSAGAITIGLPDDVTIDGNLIVGGNFTVSGSVTTLNTDVLTVEDNVIVLNSNVTGTPTTNAGIEVERGDSTNASLIWDESLDVWRAGLAGSETTISLAGHTHSTSDVTGLQEYVEDTVGTMLTDSSTVDFTYSDNGGSAGTFTASVITASTSYLSTASGLSVDLASVEAQLVVDGFTKKATANLGNGSASVFVVNHGLATRDVTVQIFRNSAPYDQVEADVLHYDAADTGNTSKITVTFAQAPTSNQYRVVIIG